MHSIIDKQLSYIKMIFTISRKPSKFEIQCSQNYIKKNNVAGLLSSTRDYIVINVIRNKNNSVIPLAQDMV